MRKIRLLILVIILGFVIYGYKYKGYQNNKEDIVTNKPQRVGILLGLNKEEDLVDVLFYDNKIFIEPFENDVGKNYQSLTLTSEDYPKLFNSDSENFISADIDGDKLIISNNVFDHGGYSSVYELKVDLVSGIVEN